MPRVAPLVCTRCGSPVPVGSELAADVVKCRACSGEVPVPEDVAALRAATASATEARAKARALADELTRPPGLFTRLWMTASTVTALGVLLTLAVWVIVGVIICVGFLWNQGVKLEVLVVAFVAGLLLSVPLVHNEILHDLARPLKVDYADTLSGAGSSALLGLWFFVVLAMPLILGAYAEGFESVRATLRKVLGAKPPRTEGGPAECRVCGAALELTEGTLHARCIYCATDNLVNVPQELLELAEKDATSQHADVAGAHAEAARKRSEGIQLAIGRTWKWGVGLVLLFLVLGRIVAATLDDGRNFWRRARTDGPLVANLPSNPAIPADEPIIVEIKSTYDTCTEQYCEAYYFVALDRGERPVIKIDGLLFLDRVEERRIGKWYNPTYGWEATSLDRGAPYRGWYRVALRAPKKLRPGERMASQIVWSRKRAP